MLAHPQNNIVLSGSIVGVIGINCYFCQFNFAGLASKDKLFQGGRIIFRAQAVSEGYLVIINTK